jgi:Fe-S cluster assembly protein SufD
LTQAPDSPEVGRAGAPLTLLKDDPHVVSYATLFEQTERPTDPAWLDALRRQAIERFTQLGFPTTKDEDWHFTSVAPITSRTFGRIEGQLRIAPSRSGNLSVERATAPQRPFDQQVSEPALAPFVFGQDWHTLVFVNGTFVPSLSRSELVEGDFYIGSFAEALATMPRVLEQRLSALATFQTNAFTALNTAFLNDGAVIVLRPNVIVDRPIHLLFVTDANANGGLISPRILIIADHHAEATVVESYVSLSSATYLTNTVTEISLAPSARLRHYKIQRESAAAYHVGSSYAYQQQDSHYESFSFATGADLSRTNISTVLDGTGAHVTLNGLYMVGGTQTVDHQTRIEHVKEHCTSHEVYKGVLDDAAHGVFNGKVYVHPEAQKTDGKQSNNNLLLSDRAHIDTKPQLEIFADDVKCTHGATIGRLDETALFYLKSRGIGPELARRLLTYAFAAGVLEELTIDDVRTRLERLTFQRFGVDT